MDKQFREKFAGKIFPATITPFTADNKVNEQAMRDVMSMNIRQGASGLFIGGSSAECFLLSPEERRKTFEVASEMKDKATLIAHVGTIATHQAIEYAKYAKELGFDAIAATPPFYYGFGSEAISNYYYDISPATPARSSIWQIRTIAGCSRPKRSWVSSTQTRSYISWSVSSI